MENIHSVDLIGCGSVGSHLGMSLARQGTFKSYNLFDMDRVEEKNISNQAYLVADIGRYKAAALADLMRSVSFSCIVRSRNVEITSELLHVLKSDLIIDCTDNIRTRRLIQNHCVLNGIPCLHVATHEVSVVATWTKDYRIPSEIGVDVCEFGSSSISFLAASCGLQSIATGRNTTYFTDGSYR